MEKCSPKGAKKLIFVQVASGWPQTLSIAFVQVASGWPQTLSIADMKNFYKE